MAAHCFEVSFPLSSYGCISFLCVCVLLLLLLRVTGEEEEGVVCLSLATGDAHRPGGMSLWRSCWRHFFLLLLLLLLSSTHMLMYIPVFLDVSCHFLLPLSLPLSFCLLQRSFLFWELHSSSYKQKSIVDTYPAVSALAHRSTPSSSSSNNNNNNNINSISCGRWPIPALSINS